MEVTDSADISNAYSNLHKKLWEILQKFWDISKPKIAFTFF